MGKLAVVKVLLILYLIPVFAYGLTIPLGNALLTAAVAQGAVAEDAAATNETNALSRACQRGIGVRVWDQCSRYEILTALQAGSIGSVVLGTLLVGVPFLAGRAVRRNRRLLALVFGPSLLMVVIGTVLLIFVETILLSVTLSIGTVILTGLVFLGLLFLAPAVGAAYGITAIARSGLSLLWIPAIQCDALPSSATEQPRLWAFVRDCAQRIGTRPPRNILLGLDANFWVSEIRVRSASRTHRGRTLYLSASLCRVLNVDELNAIVGHELAHFAGADAAFSRFFYPVFRTSAEAEARLDIDTSSTIVALLLEPTRAIFDLFLDQFRRVEGPISQERELAADVAGARIASPRLMATALVKVHALANTWAHTRNVVRLAELNRKPVMNAATEFTKWAEEPENLARLDRLLDDRLAHPIDSHPPLGVRLDALAVDHRMLAQIVDIARPANPSAALIQNLEVIESRLTERLREEVVADVR